MFVLNKLSESESESIYDQIYYCECVAIVP